MAKCRMLLQENEELGKVISSGRTAKLEGEIALQKKFVDEMKISQAGMARCKSNSRYGLCGMFNMKVILGLILLVMQIKSMQMSMVYRIAFLHS